MTARSVEGLLRSFCRREASPRRSGQVSLSLYLSKMKKSVLPACLRALAHQIDGSGRPIPPALVRVALFANNCTDWSASLARKLGASWRLDIRVVEATLPPGAAHAGNARRAAMDIAEAWLLEGGEKDGVILTTDADSQVAPNWIARESRRL